MPSKGSSARAGAVPPGEAWRYLNGVRLARILGITGGRVSHLKNLGLPCEESGLYDLTRAIPWVLQRQAENNDTDGSGSVRKLYYEAMAEKSQLEAARLRGTIYGREETDAFLTGLAGAFREGILSLPERVTRDKTIAAALEKEVNASLDEFAEAIAVWIRNGGSSVRDASRAAQPDAGELG